MLTLLMCITGGLDWWDLQNLFLEIDPMLGFLFVVYISLMVLALLNIITGIFVNDALEQSRLDRDLMAKLELERRQGDMEKLEAIFAVIDTLGTGQIGLEQFLAYLDLPERRALFATLGLEISDAVSFFDSLDVDGSRVLEREEFVMGCMKLRGGAKTLDIATVLREIKSVMEKLVDCSTRLEKQISGAERRLRTNEQAAIERVRSWTASPSSMSNVHQPGRPPGNGIPSSDIHAAGHLRMKL